MSVKVMSWVWEHSPYRGVQLLVHLALADHANDDGIAWPSVNRLADKARCDRRYVQRTIEQMKTDGTVELKKGGGVVKNHNGEPVYLSNVYQLRGGWTDAIPWGTEMQTLVESSADPGGPQSTPTVTSNHHRNRRACEVCEGSGVLLLPDGTADQCACVRRAS